MVLTLGDATSPLYSTARGILLRTPYTVYYSKCIIMNKDLTLNQDLAAVNML